MASWIKVRSFPPHQVSLRGANRESAVRMRFAALGPAGRCAPLLATPPTTTRVAAPLCTAVAGEYWQLQPGGLLHPSAAIVKKAGQALKLLFWAVWTTAEARPRTCAAVAVVVLCCAWRPLLRWLQRSREAATLEVPEHEATASATRLSVEAAEAAAVAAERTARAAAEAALRDAEVAAAAAAEEAAEEEAEAKEYLAALREEQQSTQEEAAGEEREAAAEEGEATAEEGGAAAEQGTASATAMQATAGIKVQTVGTAGTAASAAAAVAAAAGAAEGAKASAEVDTARPSGDWAAAQSRAALARMEERRAARAAAADASRWSWWTMRARRGAWAETARRWGYMKDDF